MRVVFSEKKIWNLLIVAFLSKITLFIYFKLFVSETVFGGGNDSDYYHGYALGRDIVIVNFWPVILRFLNEVSFYNRSIISSVNFVTSLTLMPYLYYKMIKIQSDEIEPVRAVSFLIIIFYPTLFVLSTDVYRDVLMFNCTLLSLIIYKEIIEANFLKLCIYFPIYLGLAYFLYLMRPYLGFALGLAPFFYLILLKTKMHFKSWIIIYFLVLVLVKNFGVLDEVLLYREGFTRYGYETGGATIGIGLLDKGPIMFLIYYFYSLMLQLFGLFLFNINAFIVFTVETVPFIFAFIYLIKNVKYMNNFVTFLLTFFVIYTTIWLLGNDNLGTAIRLRIPSYLVIFASMLIVYQTKVVIGYEKTNNSDL